MAFVKAVKYQAKGRIALAGPAGAGKTMTALKIATALADGGEIAVIDTERGSASKYADLFSFDVLELDNYHPDKFVQGIHEAEAAGYSVLIIDSLSHAWNGPGGLLEIVEGVAKRSKSGSTFNAWSEATPIQNRMIDAITRARMHILVTMRSKAEYVIEQNERGKSAPRKVGTAPIQREGLEYEFDLFADMDHDNTLIVQKSRCPELAGKIIAKPGADVADILKRWLDGAPAPEHVPSYRDIYTAGKSKGLWTAANGFCVFATAELGENISEDSVKTLPSEMLKQLARAVEAEQPVAQPA